MPHTEVLMKPVWLLLLLLVSLPQTACIFSGGAPPEQTPDSHDSGLATNNAFDLGEPATNNGSSNNASNNGATNNQSTNNATTITNNQTTTNNDMCVVPESSRVVRICRSDEFVTCGGAPIQGCVEPVPCGPTCPSGSTCHQLLCLSDGQTEPLVLPGGGASVAYWGPFWAASAPDAGGYGEVVVQRITNMTTSMTTIAPPEPIDGLRFGESLAGFGNFLLVGVPGARGVDFSEKAGEAILYDVETSSPDVLDTVTVELLDDGSSPVSMADAAVGASVAMGGADAEGARWLVGAPGLDRALLSFGKPGSEPFRIILPPDGLRTQLENSRFGAEVAMASDGRTVAIAAPITKKVLLFQQGMTDSDWSHAIVGLPPGAAASNEFGEALALDPDGRRLLVGDPAASVVHLFARTASGWNLIDSFGPRNSTRYGESVGMLDQFLLVGQPRGGTGGALHVIGGGANVGGYVPLAVVDAATLPGVHKGFGRSIAVNHLEGKFLVAAPAPPDGPASSALWFSGF